MRGANVLTGLTGLLLFAPGVGRAQAQAKEEFEVVSVKPFTAPGAFSLRTIGGPGTSDPSRITYEHLSFQDLLMAAYGVKRYQISGPAWLGSERYLIVATIRPGATMGQVNQMLQNLLAERFKLALHHETKDLPLYELVVAKKGPKLKESAAGTSVGTEPPPGPMLTRDKDGLMHFGAGRTGIQGLGMHGILDVAGANQTMSQLADYLSSPSRPVVDKTGLTGKYDFSLQYALSTGRANLPDDQANPAPDLLTAIQDQLGLKLEPKKGPIDVLVIDHAEKAPTED